MGVGVIAFGVAVRFDHRKLRRLAPLLLGVTFLLLLVVLVPGLGVHAQGSSRWIGFGQFRLQPSELMKLALTIFTADLITRRLDEGATDRRIIGPLLLVTASAGLLIVMQPDLGTAMVLGCIVLALLFVSGVRLGPVLKILGGLVGLALVVAVVSPYRRDRLVVLPGPVGPRIRVGLPGHAVVDRLGIGPPGRSRARRRPGAVGVPPQCPDRLHLLGHRRGAGLHRRRPGPPPPGSLRLVRHTGGHAVAASGSAACWRSVWWRGWRPRH